jgi:hypothetical protein
MEKESTRPAVTGYGEQSESGVDISLIRIRLAMTTEERIEANRQALETVEAFREAGRLRRELERKQIEQ